MTSSWCFQCYLFFTLRFLNIVQTVPPEYCLTPFNGSDCNLPPKQVFSYYKPGSRCELETWRGCPTLNMFANEYHCSLNCIFRMRAVEAEPAIELKLEDLDVERLEKLNYILDKYIEEKEDEEDEDREEDGEEREEEDDKDGDGEEDGEEDGDEDGEEDGEEDEEGEEDVTKVVTEQVTTEKEPESEERTTAEPVDYTTVDDFDEVILPY